MIPQSVIQTVADLEYGIQEKLFNQFGNVEQSIKGFRISAGKVTTVNPLTLNTDFRKDYARLVAKMLQKYPIVVTAMEVWETNSRTQQRREAAVLTLHTSDCVWTMRCLIEGGPLRRIIKGELERPLEVSGRLVTGSLTKATAKTLTKELYGLLLTGGETWKPRFGTQMVRAMHELRDISPVTNALYSPDIPSDRLADATAMLEIVTTQADLGSQADGLQVLEILLGADITLDLHEGVGDACDVDLVVKALHQNINRKLADAGIAAAADPAGKLAIAGSYIPVSAAFGLKNIARSWFSPLDPESHSPTYDEAPRAWIDEAYDRDLERFSADPLSHDLTLTLPIYMRVQAPARSQYLGGLLDAAASEPAITACLEAMAEPLRAAVNSAASQVGVNLQFEGVERLYDQLRSKHRAWLLQRWQKAVSQASSLSAERGVPTPLEDMQAVVGAAIFVKPAAHEMVLVSVFAGGDVCMPVGLQRPVYWNLADYTDMVVEVLRNCGLTQIELGSTVVKVSEHPSDALGAPMYLDANGAWFSPASVHIPAAVGVVQSFNWEFFASEDSSDPEVLTLPVPHLMQRLGAAAVMQRHFSPEVYRIVKEALSSSSRSVEQCWEVARSQHEKLDALARTHDFAVFPPEIVALSLQLQWSRSPTINVRSTLTERLRYTDLSSKLLAKAVTAPFPLQYVHFSISDPVAEIFLDHEGQKFSVALAGAFVLQRTTDAGRTLDVHLAWQNKQDKLHVLVSAVRLDLGQDEQTVAECIEASLMGGNYESVEVRGSIGAALDELFKVLFYMGSRQARIVQADDRSKLLKDIGRKTPEQQTRLVERARGLYDHIDIGPEQALSGEVGLEGLDRRQTKVSIRRGHWHGYWRGAGRTEYVVHLLEPIIVNKRLLGEDEAPPDPRGYTLH